VPSEESAGEVHPNKPVHGGFERAAPARGGKVMSGVRTRAQQQAEPTDTWYSQTFSRVSHNPVFRTGSRAPHAPLVLGVR